MESQIRSNAELVRSVAREQLGVVVDYDEAGVRWLDGYIDRQREAAEPELKARLASTLGSYLGECIRQTYGGEWLQDPEAGWTVKISEKLSVYPFNKVQKQLAEGDGESVLGFFTTIAALLAAPGLKRRWWRFW
jgi:hypothetical protein